jgi:uncharacterized protein YcfJ
MKILAMAVASACTVLAPMAFAQPYNGERDRYREDTARVISSQPVYAAGEQKEECWNPRAGHYEERRDSHGANTLGGTAAGAVIGGIIGHQFNDRAGTALGAIAGGAVGHEVAKNRSGDEQDDLDYSRCRTVSAGSGDVVGYDVTYEYRGQQYTTRMDHDPGRRVALGREIRDDGTPFDSTTGYYGDNRDYRDNRWR